MNRAFLSVVFICLLILRASMTSFFLFFYFYFLYLPVRNLFILSLIFFFLIFLIFFISKGWNPKIKNHEKNGNKVVENKNEIVINNANNFHFFWASERSGYNQIYFYHYNGNRKKCEEGVCGATCLLNGRPIGRGGNWVVDRYFYFVFN